MISDLRRAFESILEFGFYGPVGWRRSIHRLLVRNGPRVFSLGVMGDGRDTDSSRIRRVSCGWGWRGRQLPILADLGEIGTLGEGYKTVGLQHAGSGTMPEVFAAALRPIALMFSPNATENDRTR
jgi:hypothetical protein